MWECQFLHDSAPATDGSTGYKLLSNYSRFALGLHLALKVQLESAGFRAMAMAALAI